MGFGVRRWGREGHRERNTSEMVVIDFMGGGLGAGVAIADRGRMRYFREEVITVHIAARMFVHMKLAAGGERAAIAGACDHLLYSFPLLACEAWLLCPPLTC